LTRRLVDTAHDVIVTEEDCGTDQSLEIDLLEAERIGQSVGQRLAGRISAETVKDEENEVIVKKGDIINWRTAKKIKEERDAVSFLAKLEEDS